MTSITHLKAEGLSVSFPESWSVDDNGTEISLYRSKDGGAITITSYRHSDPRRNVSAVEQCRRFLVSRGQNPEIVRGSASEATADFEDDEHYLWITRTLAFRNRFALGTYNTRTRDLEEELQARQILTSIELHVAVSE